MTQGPSAEAVTLAERFAATDAAASVEAMRVGLAEEFRFRAERASARHAVTQSERQVAGVRCLVLSPVELRSATVVLYIFGGGYVSGAPELELPIAAHLCAASGMTVILPDYPLAPEHPYPAALHAVRGVYAALAQESPVLLSGESAGGGLALCLLPEISTPPVALCLFSPWIDLTDAGHDGALATDPSLTPDDLRLAAEAYCPDTDRAQVSPALWAWPDLPPTFISSGTRDIMLPMLRRFATHPSVDLAVWPGLWHVFECYDELPEAAQSLDQAADFITRQAAR